MSESWRLIVRSGPRVERSTYPTLEAALDALELEANVLTSSGPRRQAVDMRIRTFEPIDQVAARIEVAGPRRFMPDVVAGIDVRGDGSAEAFIGRRSRRLVQQRKRESPAAALRRAMAEQLTGPESPRSA